MKVYKKIENEFVEIEVRETTEIALNVLKDNLRANAIRFGSHDDTEKYLRLKISHLEYETFGILILDNKNKLIECVELFRGTVNQARVYIREIIREIMKHNGVNIILFHNHPSGDPSPSQDDIQLTKKIQSVVKHIEVGVHDHLIIGGESVYSLMQNGQMNQAA